MFLITETQQERLGTWVFSEILCKLHSVQLYCFGLVVQLTSAFELSELG